VPRVDETSEAAFLPDKTNFHEVKAMSKRLGGKVAIITGAGTGIGEAVAHKFAREGARVVVNGLPDDPVQDVTNAIRDQGGEAIAYAGDVSEEEHALACVQKAIAEFGRLDVLVNNAGVFLTLAETQDFPIEEFDRTIRMNIRSAFLMTKYALPHLQESRGNIVSAGSEAGFNGLMQNTAYGGTKAWMHAFMQGVAVEQAKYGVRANCVCPGPIDTAWTHKETGPMNKKIETATVESTVFGRRGTPEEVANVYAFIASDEASYVTGALWLVDGGITVSKAIIGAEASKEVREQPVGELQLEHSHDGMKGKMKAAGD
jgi:NAD(P)-dependent dehydrogenase (short-subunit alcohol dehydrogenase family)